MITDAPRIAAQTPEEVDDKRLADCRLASQVLTHGSPANKFDWALQTIGACGADGGAALAAFVRSVRASTDTAWLNRVTQGALYLHDGELFPASLEVADDASASIPARIFAMRTLMNHVEPTLWFHGAADLAPPLTDLGVQTCHPSFLGHGLASQGAALPVGFGETVRNFARRVSADAAAPEAVRTAAYCATQYLIIDP